MTLTFGREELGYPQGLVSGLTSVEPKLLSPSRPTQHNSCPSVSLLLSSGPQAPGRTIERRRVPSLVFVLVSPPMMRDRPFYLLADEISVRQLIDLVNYRNTGEKPFWWNKASRKEYADKISEAKQPFKQVGPWRKGHPRARRPRKRRPRTKGRRTRSPTTRRPRNQRFERGYRTNCGPSSSLRSLMVDDDPQAVSMAEAEYAVWLFDQKWHPPEYHVRSGRRRLMGVQACGLATAVYP